MNKFERISRAVFFFPKEEVADSLMLKMKIDEIFPQLKDREIVLFTKMKLPKNQLENTVKSATLYSEKEFNFFGKTKNNDFLKIFEKRYDTILVFGTVPKMGSKLIKQLKTSDIIGVNSENDFLQIKLSTNSVEPSEMLKFVQNTLSKIH